MADTSARPPGLLEEMVAVQPARPRQDGEIKELEHRCDFLTHEIIQRLHRTFVTPIDREDIHALAKALDDVMDAIDASAHLFAAVPDRDASRDGARKFCHITVSATEQIRVALTAHGERETRDAERRGDQPPRERGRPPAPGGDHAACSTRRRTRSLIMKWKEIFDYLEATVDSIEDVSDVIQGVILKHA